MAKVGSHTARAAIYKIAIEHSQYRKAMARLTDLYVANAQDGVVDGLFITGPAGSGKTFLRNQFVSLYPRREEPERTIMPVVCFSMPSNPKGKALYQMALAAFGTNYLSGTETALEARLIKLLRSCGTVLIVVDEAQHLIDRGGKKMHEKAADNLKTLMNEAGVSVVILGTDRVLHLLEVNEQLRRRFSEQIRLEPWRPRVDVDVNEFAGVVVGLLNSPEINIGYDSLVEPAFLNRLIYGCGGRISYLVKLVAEAVQLASEKGRKSLLRADFEQAFKAKIWAAVKPEVNPFSQAFIERPLTAPGEPFWMPE